MIIRLLHIKIAKINTILKCDMMIKDAIYIVEI